MPMRFGARGGTEPASLRRTRLLPSGRHHTRLGRLPATASVALPYPRPTVWQQTWRRWRRPSCSTTTPSSIRTETTSSRSTYSVLRASATIQSAASHQPCLQQEQSMMSFESEKFQGAQAIVKKLAVCF